MVKDVQRHRGAAQCTMPCQIININYHRVATVGEELVIETAMRDIGTKSAIMRHVVKMKGTTSVIADADVTFVIVGGDAGGGVALHEDLRECLRICPSAACEVCSMLKHSQ
jgi:acyl-CoA thioesterase FadM